MRVRVLLFEGEEDGREIELPLLFSFRIDDPCEVDGRPERLLYPVLGRVVVVVPSPLKEEADPLLRSEVDLL